MYKINALGAAPGLEVNSASGAKQIQKPSFLGCFATERPHVGALMSKDRTELGQVRRSYPIGAELVGENKTHFRVWAPKARELEVVVEYGPNSQRTFHPLSPEQGGYFSGALDVGVGTRYWFRVNSGERFYPDPASRFQPEGPHGSSCIVDPRQFHWTDSQWPGPAAAGLKGQIIYEGQIGRAHV